MAPVLAFCCAALILAALAFPIAQRLFRRFPDAGAGLSFPLGLMLCSYGYFILRTADILPQGRGGFILAFALFAAVAFVVARSDPRFISTTRRSSAGIAASVGVFTAAFFGYAAFRSYQSSIGGTEQPMDFLFLNAMLESPSYPPEDPWFAGNSVSYYYFGYLQSALLTGASGVESSLGYNLGLASVFASSAAAIASLCIALARWVIGRNERWGVVAAGSGIGLLLFAGSLIGIFEFAAAHERYNETLYRTFGVESLLPCDHGVSDDCYSGRVDPRTDSWYPDEFWFWWRGSRVIPGTITEFPAFSFLLGDLHPHVMSLPGVILAAALALTLWRGRSPLDFETVRRKPFLVLILALIFGGLAFQNTWDVLTLSVVLAVAVVARNARTSTLVPAVRGSAALLVPAGLLAVVLYAPWWVTFSSQAGGLYAYAGEGTRPNHAFLQFGVPVLATLLIALVALRQIDARGIAANVVYGAWLPTLPILAWFAFAAVRGDWGTAVNERGAGGWTTLAILALALWLLASTAFALHERHRPAAAVAIVGTVGVLLIYGAELFFIRDVFFGGIPRLNTVFKLTYQAWILLAIAGSVALTATIAEAVRNRRALLAGAAPVVLLLLLSIAYVVQAIPNRTGGFGNESDLDGLAALARNDPAEYALTRWVAGNIPPGDVIIEATGRRWLPGEDGPQLQPAGVSYTDAGRISSRTGRPAPIGWYSHQVQWRGDTEANHAAFSRRQDAVDGVYLAASSEEALGLLAELGAAYVIDGRLEQSRYPAQHRIDLESFLDVVFESEGLRIFRVPSTEEVPTS